ncbi:MAG: YraN family protein [bacterium]
MNKILGRQGEDQAARFLEAQGYRIVSRNLTTRFGEIDLVAQDQGVLVFVEVKARSTTEFGTPAEAVTLAKLAKIRRVIADFVAHSHWSGPVRFEVVAILKAGRPQLIREIEFIDR